MSIQLVLRKANLVPVLLMSSGSIGLRVCKVKVEGGVIYIC